MKIKVGKIKIQRSTHRKPPSKDPNVLSRDYHVEESCSDTLEERAAIRFHNRTQYYDMVKVELSRLKIPKQKLVAPNYPSPSIKHGQLEPIIITKDLHIVDGICRVKEAISLGWTEIEARYV